MLTVVVNDELVETVGDSTWRTPHDRFETDVDDDGMTFYYSAKVFPSGMTGRIEFLPTMSDNLCERDVFISVSLVVYRKRKHAWQHTAQGCGDTVSTGRDGMQPLVWAKSELVAFEDFFATQTSYCSNHRVFMEVQWGDSRRKKLYQKVLEPMGYRMLNNPHTGWALTKELAHRSTSHYWWE